jgi:hypothetical protein
MQNNYSNNKEFKKWLVWSIFLYSCLVFNILEPFEISIKSFVPVYHLVLCGHGVVAVLVIQFLENIIKPYINHQLKKWTILHSGIWLIFIVIIVSIFNWLYTLLLHYSISGWHNIYVPVRGFFEIVPKFLAVYSVWGFLGLMSIYLLFKDKVNSEESSSLIPEQMISLYSDNQTDKFRIKESDIICFKTCDNYLELFYINEEKQLKTRLIRSSMKRMMFQLDSHIFYRPHQSYLINKAHMKGLVRVKNQTYIELAYLDFYVNVSRGNLKKIKSILVS